MSKGSRVIHQDTVEEVTELRSFGRRRGRIASPRQQQLMSDVLPGISLDLKSPTPADLNTLFEPPVDEVWLEIGFGGAEHMIWQADRNRNVGLIGCEPYEDGVVKALRAVQEMSLNNVLLHADDARDALRWLPEKSISRCFVLFPDPWPKKRHVRRRLVNPQLFRALGRVMKPGGELRIGTDIGDYLRTILIAFQQQSDFVWPCSNAEKWRVRPDDWPQTRYEQKAVREGRRCYYLSFIRA